MPTRLLFRTLAFAFLSALLAISPATFAATKHYSVTAPDGVALAVQESGNPQGQSIVFIHGLLGSHLSWDAQIKSPRLGGYRIITYDMRGHGLSDKPAGSEAYRDGMHWADDLSAVIKASHADRPILVGWSLGAAVISNYLAKFGDDRISGAVYVDGVTELKPDQLVDHSAVYNGMASSDLKTHLDAVRAFLDLCFNTRPDTPTFERLLSNASMASWEMTRTVPSMTINFVDGMKNTHVPMLFIYGAQDALVQTGPAMSRAMDLNPNIETKLYAHSGHAPFIEEPDRFNRDLSQFIEATLQH